MLKVMSWDCDCLSVLRAGRPPCAPTRRPFPPLGCGSRCPRGDSALPDPPLAPGATRHLLPPPPPVCWAGARCPLRGGEGGQRPDLVAASRTAPWGTRGTWAAAPLTPCTSVPRRGERPSPVPSGAPSAPQGRPQIRDTCWGRGCWPRPAAASGWETRVSDRHSRSAPARGQRGRGQLRGAAESGGGSGASRARSGTWQVRVARPRRPGGPCAWVWSRKRGNRR